MLIIGNVPIIYNENSPLNGSFAYIQKISGTEEIVKENYIKVSVSSSSNQNIELPITNQTFDTLITWYSRNEENSWYEIDFLNNFFYLESYLIRNHGQDFFREWKILGSNDGINYQEVDHKTDFQKPSETHINILFNCSKPATFRIFRYIPIGTRYLGDYYLFFHRLQFYGSFMDAKSMKLIKYTKHHFFQNIKSFIVACYIFILFAEL